VAGAEQRRVTDLEVEPYFQSGVPLSANFSARPTHVNLHFERSIMWSGVAAWHELVNAAAGDKRALLGDDTWRLRARRDWDECRFTLAPIKVPDRLLLIGGPDSGCSLDQVARRHRRHPSDVLADWLLATDLQGNLRSTDRLIDDQAAAEAVRHPHLISGASDAGAHIQMFSGAGDGTYLITHLARDLGLVSLEEAVHAVTAKQAAFFGLAGRGVIAPGAIADLAVFELDELVLGDEMQVADLPGGSWRYTRTPGGYRTTVVAGVPTWADAGSTGQRPGRFLSQGDGSLAG
jgi:N-acyl-D-aspartate/D-glutamate deacylase